LAKAYIEFKRQKNLAWFPKIELAKDRAAKFWGDRSIKLIRRPDIRKFLYSIEGISEKTRYNHRTVLHNFWHEYLYGEEEILSLADLPRFPDVPYEMGFRKMIDINDREKILETIRERTKENPKAWLAIDMLCAYGQIRPVDLSRLTEGDIDVKNGIVTFWRPSKTKMRKQPKVIRLRLLPDHLEVIIELKEKYPAMSSMPFFRHTKGRGRKADTPFGQNYLYKKIWKPACAEHGIYDLDLYGGTRHSSTTALAIAAGKDKARDFSGHNTNKAFDRYCQVDDESFDMAQLLSKLRKPEKRKVVNLKARTTSAPRDQSK